MERRGEGISLSVNDKIRIAQKLDQFGMDTIEGGWPGSNPKDMEFFTRVRTARLKHARIAAFGSTRRAKIKPQDDFNIRHLLKGISSCPALKRKGLEAAFDSLKR